MNPETEKMEALTEFERNARTVLEESVRRVDARTRSRLNQARHAALETAAAPRRRGFWRSFALMPAAGAAAAAVLVAIVMWPGERRPELPLLEAPHSVAEHAGVEDIDLLADGEAMELLEGEDGSFYEWAVAQDGGESNG